MVEGKSGNGWVVQAVPNVTNWSQTKEGYELASGIPRLMDKDNYRPGE